MKSLPLILFMIALASYSLQAQDVVVYTHYERPYKSTTKPSNEIKEVHHTKPVKDSKPNQLPLHATPVGNFLNVSHKLSKNSTYQVYDDKGKQFLYGRLTANGVIPVKNLSKGTYKLHLNHQPILWFIKK